MEHFGAWADERVQSPWLRLFYWFARHQMGHSHQPNHRDTPLSLPPCSSLQSLIDHLRYCMWPGTNAWNRTGRWSKRFFLASDIVCKHNLTLWNCLLSKEIFGTPFLPITHWTFNSAKHIWYHLKYYLVSVRYINMIPNSYIDISQCCVSSEYLCHITFILH